MKPTIQPRFEANLKRVENLVEFYQRETGGARGRSSVHESDLLRAAVVLLHATLEDLIRSLSEWKLPERPVDSFREIPFYREEHRSAEKFTLVDLAALRGREVNDVMKESVHAWLARQSYNGKEQLSAALCRLGFVGDEFHRFDDDLDAMMKRRHLIAHRADWNQAPGSGQHRARSLQSATVQEWLTVVRLFGAMLLDAS